MGFYSDDLPHGSSAEARDVDGGKMDGFVGSERGGCNCTSHLSMGYYNESDIPVFWQYAKDYTLTDNFFEQVASWSYPSHLAMVSEWAASCRSPTDPMSCSANADLDFPGWKTWPALNTLPWTDITYLLHAHGVEPGYYHADGTQPVCSPSSCTMASSNPGTPVFWNPLPCSPTCNRMVS